MALDLTGIDNVEFYSAHYLDAVLEGDLKSLFARWKEEKDAGKRRRLPQEELAGLAQTWFEAVKQVADDRDPVARFEAARGFHAKLVEALGYPYRPSVEALDATATLPEAVVPTVLALERDGRPDLWVLDAGFPEEEDDDPFEATPLPQQLPGWSESAGAANSGDSSAALATAAASTESTESPESTESTGPTTTTASTGLDLPVSEDDKTALATWRELLDRRIFRLERPPRWVIFLAGREAYLVERHKWPQGRLLRFDLGELFRRKQASAMRAMAALLHRDALAPDSGLCLHDSLDESSHKHAFAVSGDLKHGVRRAVELLANEVVRYRREVQRKAVFDVAPEFESVEELASCLTSECLTWLYRLLFLFYVEARGGELDVVPMRSDAYRKGYSLETLRDLELAPLTSEKARNGYFLHQSLETLFRVLDRGFPPEPFLSAEGTAGKGPAPGRGAGQFVFENTMQVDALHSPLFDDERLRVLKGVKLRNVVVQEILRLLSLSSESRGRRRGAAHGSRGRISYAQLGINQLGAVYEGLLSYSGFFADEDLYEVANAADNQALSGRAPAAREDAKTYFAPESRIDDYQKAEIVKGEDGKPVVHPKGTFLFRLSGRNREKSASYYTPEVLTRCVVKYALEELLWERDAEWRRTKRKKSADEILSLALCEPAMGSSAFLIEAVDQLADAYLEAKQEELAALGVQTQVPPEDYQEHKRRVMARLATNNCYGVDLNPTAVELARVSLWLATLHRGGKCPWFGLRLACGNSLIGARREVFHTKDLIRKGTKAKPNWLELVPEPVPLAAGGHGLASHGAAAASEGASSRSIDAAWKPPPRPRGTVYHFLVPADGMAPFDKEKVVKELAREAAETIKAWRKEFTKPFSKGDADRLERLSDAVDRLFAQVVRERVLATSETSDRIPVWGEGVTASAAKAAAAENADVAIADEAALDLETEMEPNEMLRAEAPGAGFERLAADPAERRGLLVRDQEEVARALEHQSSPFRRLQLVMDAWCALWFWPIEKAHLLPSRETWLLWLELILRGEVTPSTAGEQIGLFEEALAQGKLPLQASVPGALEPSAVAQAQGAGRGFESERLARLRKLAEAFGESRAGYLEECGLAMVDQIVAEDEGLQVVVETAERHRFHHWELRFAEVFAERRGFDLMVGNPPWIKLQWQDAGFLSDLEPTVAIRKLSATAVARQRAELLAAAPARSGYLAALQEMEGTQTFLNAPQNYPLLRGVQPNLYRCFVTGSWRLGGEGGSTGFLHPEGMYDDPKGGALREALYPRLVDHAQFVNEFKLFPEVGHTRPYSVNVYRATPASAVRFRSMSNLFHPGTIDASHRHDGHGAVPGIKNESNEFDATGHRNRVLHLNETDLELFARLYDDPGTPALQARLPVVHSREILRVLERFAAQPRRLGDLKDEYFATEMWHETNAQKDGTIRRETRFPKDASEWILQGPHFYVATPFNKTPNEGCRNHLDYTAIDLATIPDDYLPRTNYVPACSPEEYRKRTPKWKGRLVTEYYRYGHREMVSPTGERTLVPMIIPPGCGHVNTLFSLCFTEPSRLVEFAGCASSLIYDFFIKTTGKGHVNDSLTARLPILPSTALSGAIVDRVLALTCGTVHFEGLASALGRLVHPEGQHAGSSSDGWPTGGEAIRPLRSDAERRRALLEIDVLASLSVGIDLNDLIGVYRAQFPVLQQNERSNLYDQNGRVVPTSKTASGNPAVNLVELATDLHDQTGFDTQATYAPDSPEVADLLPRRVKLKSRDAEILGVPERCTMADLLAETEVRWSDDEHPEGRPVRLFGLRYTDPGLEPRMERVYPTPWTRCDREEDYRVAWAEFERRLGPLFASTADPEGRYNRMSCTG